MPRTRIVCTIGPATESEDRVRALLRAGMNVARINFSHGTLDDHKKRIDTLRRVAAQENHVLALLGDLSGPKLRVGDLPNNSFMLARGELVRFSLGESADGSAIPLDFPFLGNALRSGDHMLLDDGTKEVEVVSANANEIQARVLVGGELRSHKGVNLPNVALPIPSLSEKDRVNAVWAIEQDFDYLALSFVRRAADVAELRELVHAHESRIPIISKIEKPEAVQDIDAILHESDGVMVARGDLGVEMPAEQVPITQKMIIHKANSLGIPVITATQMLESMIENPRPTRAEASDVANAVLDGSDAVMLSGETAIGQYPIEAVEAMCEIAEYTEQFMEQEHVNRATLFKDIHSVTNAIGHSTVELARELNAKLIITLTSSGYSARMVARHRPGVPILAVAVEERIRRRLALVWGVQTIVVGGTEETERFINEGLAAARGLKLVAPGDRVVITAGVPAGVSGQTNMVQVRKA
ncbi:MAG TPA: pyruvate kinase [Anaerolineae bacterium]|nr:pyruvate kinase [Anaerolineae bacterium]